jgi:hypothetical protein
MKKNKFFKKSLTAGIYGSTIANQKYLHNHSFIKKKKFSLKIKNYESFLFLSQSVSFSDIFFFTVKMINENFFNDK